MVDVVLGNLQCFKLKIPRSSGWVCRITAVKCLCNVYVHMHTYAHVSAYVGGLKLIGRDI